MGTPKVYIVAIKELRNREPRERWLMEHGCKFYNCQTVDTKSKIRSVTQWELPEGYDKEAVRITIHYASGNRSWHFPRFYQFKDPNLAMVFKMLFG